MTRLSKPGGRRWPWTLAIVIAVSMLPFGVAATWHLQQYQALTTRINGTLVASIGNPPLAFAQTSVDWTPYAVLTALWLAGVLCSGLAAHWVFRRRMATGEAIADEMAQRIVHADHQHTVDLAERTTLLREVHHRVKNNLQLVASIMNMHARVVQTSEARRLLSQLQRRVRGLATVHQTLSASSQLTSVDSRELFDSLVQDLRTLDTRSMSVTTEIASVRMSADQAVALCMLVSEAMDDAVRRAEAAPGARAEVCLSLVDAGNGQARLSVRNSAAGRPMAPDEDVAAGNGLGRRMIDALVSQLDGQSQIVETDHAHEFRVTFPLTLASTADQSALSATAADTTLH